MLLAEIDHLKARLNATRAILDKRRIEKAAARGRKQENWQSIGSDESVAFAFKHAGHEIRKIGLREYQVRLK
jgi:hypothetical protein